MDPRSILTVSFVILALAFGGAYFATDGQFAVTSVSTVEYTSNGDFFNGEMIQIGWKSGEGGAVETIYATLDQVAQNYFTDATTIVINVKNQKSEAIYPFRASSYNMPLTSINPVHVVKDHADDRDQWVNNNCMDIGNDGSLTQDVVKDGIIANDGADYEAFCLRKIKVTGTPYSLSDPNLYFETTFNITIKDSEGNIVNTYSSTVSNGDQYTSVDSVPSDNPVAKIEWIGGWSTGDMVADPATTHVLWNPQTENAVLANTNDFDNWREYVHTTDMINTLKNWNDGGNADCPINSSRGEHTCDQIDNAIDTREAMASSPISDSVADIPTDGQLTASATGGIGAEGSYTVAGEGMELAQFNMYLKADDVVVEKTVGEPKITEWKNLRNSTQSQTGQLRVTFENIQKEDTFDATVACGQGISPNDQTKSISGIKGGETKTFIFGYSGGGVNGDISATCSTSVTARGSGITDTASTTAYHTGSRVCTVGAQESGQALGVAYDDASIYECRSTADGANEWVKLKTCTGDTQPEAQNDGTYACEDPGGDGDERSCQVPGLGHLSDSGLCEYVVNPIGNIGDRVSQTFENLVYGSVFEKVNSILNLIIAVFGFIIGYGLTREYLTPLARLSRKGGVVAGIVMGSLLAVLGLAMFGGIYVKIAIIILGVTLSYLLPLGTIAAAFKSP